MYLSIIIPIYNEALSLEKLINKILNIRLKLLYEIIIVDSGSTDGSSEIIEKLIHVHSFKLIKLKKNLGKGFAVKEGLKVSVGEVIIIQDGDLEYEPSDYLMLLSPIQNKKYDFVLGSRHLKLKTWRIRKAEQFSLSLEIINIGSQVLTFIFCKLFCVKLTDTQTMYKVFSRKIIQNIILECNGFDLDWEILAKLILSGNVPCEIPVHYQSRTKAEGKKLRFFKDGLSAIFIIFKIKILSIFSLV